MYLRTIEIYCFVDDLLKSINHREDSRRKFSDSELLSAAIIAMLYFGGNFEAARRFLKSSDLMPRMLSRSRFSRRLHQASRLLEFVFARFSKQRKQQNWQKLYLLDSFPVSVCDNIRINRCRIIQDSSWRGYRASHRRFFYGVRVSVLSDADGVPVELCILPGSAQDLSGLAELPLDLPAESKIVLDAAYTYFEWEDYLLEREQIELLVQRKHNSRRADMPATKDYKQIIRKQIETVFSDINKLFAKKIHAVTVSGFILKVALFVIAFAFNKAIFLN
jgi:hypothetical protein